MFFFSIVLHISTYKVWQGLHPAVSRTIFEWTRTKWVTVSLCWFHGSKGKQFQNLGDTVTKKTSNLKGRTGEKGIKNEGTEKSVCFKKTKV